MTTYLITGGAGFIGSSLSKRLLEEGNKIIAIDNFCDFYNPKIKENNVKELEQNANFKLYRADIRDRQALNTIFEENNIDIVMHLAAMAGVRPSIESGSSWGPPPGSRRWRRCPLRRIPYPGPGSGPR